MPMTAEQITTKSQLKQPQVDIHYFLFDLLKDGLLVEFAIDENRVRMVRLG